MSKELTTLEILDLWHNAHCVGCKTSFPSLICEHCNEQKHYEIIRNELEKLYEKRKIEEQLYPYLCEDEEKLLKKLQALEISNKKEVDIHRLKTCFSIHEYNRRYEEHEYHLTEEEFNLLKEVLL